MARSGNKYYRCENWRALWGNTILFDSFGDSCLPSCDDVKQVSTKNSRSAAAAVGDAWCFDGDGVVSGIRTFNCATFSAHA